MNVAEDVRNAGLVKNNVARAASLVKPEIEALALKKRKHVVEKWILVGKLHRCTNRHHQNMGLETFVPLNQTRPIGILRNGKARRRCASHGSKPQHDITRWMALNLFSTIHQCHICGYGDVLRA